MARLDDKAGQARVAGETLAIDWPRPGVALVTFERAAERNALSLTMIDELTQALAIAHRARVAALISRGLHPVLARLYASRGVCLPEEIETTFTRLVPPVALKGASDAQKAQQNKMKTCNKDAADKKLKGDERKKFMSSCLSA